MPRPGGNASASRWRFIAICLAFAVVVVGKEYWRLNREVDGLFQFDVEVRAFDKDSGEALQTAISHTGKTGDSRLRQSPAYTATSSTTMQISGISVDTFEFSVGSRGYKSRKIVLKKDDDTSEPMDIRLERDPQQAAGP